MPRKTASSPVLSKLPPNVAVTGRWYCYRPWQGRANGKRQWGQRIRLCHRDAPLSIVWRRYEEVTQGNVRTLQWLFDQFFASRDFAELKPKTQVDYRNYVQTLCDVPLRDGTVFGSTRIAVITPLIIQQHLDNYPHPVSANRQVSVLKRAWNWASCRFDDIGENPAIKTRLNRERPRLRYVSDEELHRALHLAPPWLSATMELAYLCRGRRHEILSLLRSENLREDGVWLRRGKGSRDEITLYTPRLRHVVEMALDLEGESDHLIRTPRGKINVPQFNSAWRRLMAKVGGEPWTLHDLKAKALSDMRVPDAGHRSPAMLDVYIRKPRKILPEYDSD